MIAKIKELDRKLGVWANKHPFLFLFLCGVIGLSIGATLILVGKK